MKHKTQTLALMIAATLLGGATASFGQTKNQAGGLPALADEVAALRAMVEDLQEQVGGNADPYSGTFAVSVVETALFGCRLQNGAPLPSYLPQYFVPLTNSSVSIRAAKFDAEADGEVLAIPAFELLTHELLVGGHHRTRLEIEDGAAVDIGGDGSISANIDGAQIEGQFSADGSMFSAVVVDYVPDDGLGTNTCDDASVVNLIGVRK